MDLIVPRALIVKDAVSTPDWLEVETVEPG